MHLRSARSTDAPGMSGVLTELVVAKKRTGACDADFTRTYYIDHPDQLQCSVALNGAGDILDFQSLKLAHPDNPYGAPVGWGIIGTYVRPTTARLEGVPELGIR